jgi:hypothetical protein
VSTTSPEHSRKRKSSGRSATSESVVRYQFLGLQTLSLGRQAPISGADAFAAGLLPLVQALQSSGATTLEALARDLNGRGVRPPRADEEAKQREYLVRHAGPLSGIVQ